MSYDVIANLQEKSDVKQQQKPFELELMSLTFIFQTFIKNISR